MFELIVDGSFWNFVLLLSVLLNELLKNLSAVLMFVCYLCQTCNNTVLKDLITFVANKHNQFCTDIHTFFESDFQCCLWFRFRRYCRWILVNKIVDSFCISFELCDLIWRQRWRIIDIFDFRQKLCQCNDNFRTKNVLNMFDIGLSGHIISNG